MATRLGNNDKELLMNCIAFMLEVEGLGKAAQGAIIRGDAVEAVRLCFRVCEVAKYARSGLRGRMINNTPMG